MVKHIDNGVVVLEWQKNREKLVLVTNLSGDDFTIELDKGKDMLHNTVVENKIIVQNMDLAILKIKE